MLQQFEDALVQYDELDALFTQYVLNFGAGGELSPPVRVFLFFFPSLLQSGVGRRFIFDRLVFVRRHGQLAGVVLRPGAQLERPAAAAAHRHGEEGQHPARRGQPVGPEELPVLSAMHFTDLPAETLGGHAESLRAAPQLCAGAAPAGGKLSPVSSSRLYTPFCLTAPPETLLFSTSCRCL